MESDIFYQIYDELPRVGPGDDASTLKALEVVKTKISPARILDLSAGNGQQTFVLAKNTNAIINALDNDDAIIERLENEEEGRNISSRIFCFDADMHELPFEEKEFDLLWSEGAIFTIGFEKGVNYWKTIMKEKGFMVVSELNWIKSDPPPEIFNFWKNGYPRMTHIDKNLSQIDKLGFEIIEHFILPENAWWDEYYSPLEKRLEIFKKRYSDKKPESDTLDYIQTEIDMYRKYSDYYGYVFYIFQLK